MADTFNIFNMDDIDWINPKVSRKRHSRVSVGKLSTDHRRYISFHGSLEKIFSSSRIKVGYHKQLKRLYFCPSASNEGYKIQRNVTGTRFKISIPDDAIDLAQFEGNHNKLCKSIDDDRVAYYIKCSQEENSNG